MSELSERELLDVMGFIVDAVAQETQKTGRAEIGIYLIGLVLAECYGRESEKASCSEVSSHRDI